MSHELTSRLLSYVPMDRRQALTQKSALPAEASGAAIFADISGFTHLADVLVRSLGPHRGVEELVGFLNRVYEPLIAEVDRYAGSVISFVGDGLMAWFDSTCLPRASGEPEIAFHKMGDSHLEGAVLRAAACAFAMQGMMKAFRGLWIARGLTETIGLKIAVAGGEVRRLLVGNPQIQVIEVLAGPPIIQVGLAAQCAGEGEVLLDARAASCLAPRFRVRERHSCAQGQERFFVTDRMLIPGGPLARASIRAAKDSSVADQMIIPVEPQPWPEISEGALSAEHVRPWVLLPVAQRLESGQGEFLTELRFTVSLFIGLQEPGYEADPGAWPGLDSFVRWVQETLSRFEGWLLSVTTGDKGCYLYAVFGAPMAHGDDAIRAAAAGLDLLSPPSQLSFAGRPRIGIAGGLSRAGNVGATTRTYGVMGDATNLAARLMEAAQPGQILLSATLASAVNRRFLLKPVRPATVKGKAEPVPVVTLLGRRPVRALHREEPQTSFAFVGREAELACLDEKIGVTLRGEGQIVRIIGEAGIGKSRLANEAVQRAAEAGFECLIGEGQSIETQAAYLAWQPIWRAFFGLHGRGRREDEVGAVERDLASLNSELLPRLPLLSAPLGFTIPDNALTQPLDPRTRKESLEGLLVDCLHSRAQRVPLLLLMEDTQWLDALSSDLLDAAGRAVATMPLLLVTTSRPPDSAQAMSAPLQDDRGTVIHLKEFTTAEASEMIRERLQLAFGPQVSVSHDFVETVTLRTEGNPFYIEEMIDYLQYLAISPSDTKALQDAALPASLASLILSRIDRLSPTQQMTLKVASIIGRVFRADLLRVANPTIGTEEEVNQALEALARLDFTPLNTDQPHRTYVFKHATIQEVVYQSMAHALRSELHERLASWMEQSPSEADSLDVLAYHYGQGRNRTKQREYFEKAGHAAAARYANAAAIQYYERLLELLGPTEEPPVLIALADVLERTGQWKAAETRYLRAIDLAGRQQNPLLRAQAQLGFARLQRFQGDYAAAAATLENARGEFMTLGDFAGSFDTSTELVRVSMFRGEGRKAEALMEETLRKAEQDGDAPRLAQALHQMGNITAAVGSVMDSKVNLAAARPWWVRSLELHQELGNKLAVGMLYSNLAYAFYVEGEIEQAESLIRKGIGLFREIGSRWQLTRSHTTLALVLMEKGDLEAARAALAAGLALSCELGALQEIGDGLIVMAAIARCGGPSPAVFRYVLRLYGAAHRLKEQGGNKLVVLQKRLEDTVAEARQNLGEEEAEAELAAGAAMSWQDAVQYAVNFGGTP